MIHKHAGDHHRTAYHFQSPTNWMNDPNGLVQWQGDYHLFYQYNPDGPLFGKIHWGHAVSYDLLHWTHLPVALSPTPGGPDEDGCWSGCLVNDKGIPTLVYSGNAHGRQLPCLATSFDGLLTWQKHIQNPVIQHWPEGLDVVEFRDHCVWQEDDIWYQIIGSGIKDVGGTVLLYRSRDLLSWEFIQPLCIGNKAETGTMWECPDFFPLGDKYVLTISSIPDGLVYYFTGTYQNFTFTPETRGVLDASTHFYAPQSMQDDQGRRLLFGWLREGRGDQEIQTAGWAGAMSLPRILSLTSGHQLKIEPASELQQLRRKHHTIPAQPITGDNMVITDLSTNALEIVLEIDAGSTSMWGLRIQDSSYPEEIITVTVQKSQLVSEFKFQGINSRLYEAEMCELQQLKTLSRRLHIFLDGSVMEIFVDEQMCLTERFYFSMPQHLSLALFANEGEAQLYSLDIWEMDTIWHS
ncbi:glycosyl hydrolase family 32 [Dictyobacter alpinus]|uniref:beta-fructofuranosidase n=1 Tax=Dictyobacter alpinus TaxID=2014873 RepID=A0A402AZM4_9CHLR|nr:glycoside hydrolase family 32 protein [Dictyobacter alpinus]GCE24556.1 glycosyl hydrolase family 32 [Dictyobacter alpinus]